MARIPDLKRIAVEDFPQEYQDLVRRLALPINSHIEQVRSAFAGNIDFTNLSQEIRTLNFTTNSNGQPITELSFKSSINKRVEGMIPVSLNITSSNTQFPTQYPFLSFSQNGEIITISNIAGLQPETSYNLTVLTL